VLKHTSIYSKTELTRTATAAAIARRTVSWSTFSWY